MAKQTKPILDDAERRVQALMGEAAAQGAYEDVLRLTDLARSLHELAQSAGGNGALADAPPAERPARETADPVRNSRRRPVPMSSTAQGGKRRAKKGDYPKFFRRGDDLVKIGWSKKGKTEYQHKAPRRVIDALAAAIARRSGNGRLFTVEDLLPLKDQDGSELPAYQVYVALAWFRSAGMVKQHGRRGYTVTNNVRMWQGVSSAWGHLFESPY